MPIVPEGVSSERIGTSWEAKLPGMWQIRRSGRGRERTGWNRQPRVGGVRIWDIRKRRAMNAARKPAERESMISFCRRRRNNYPSGAPEALP